jgi:hypothetical protein
MKYRRSLVLIKFTFTYLQSPAPRAGYLYRLVWGLRPGRCFVRSGTPLFLNHPFYESFAEIVSYLDGMRSITNSETYRAAAQIGYAHAVPAAVFLIGRVSSTMRSTSATFCRVDRAFRFGVKLRSLRHCPDAVNLRTRESECHDKVSVAIR